MPKKTRKIESVVFLGDAGFPNGWAAVQRITLLGRALMEEGCESRVVCRIGVWNKDVKTEYGKEGVHEGIHYYYTTDSPFRPDDSIKRKYQKAKGLFMEFFYLLKLKRQGKMDAVILSTLNFDDSLRYWIYSRLMGFPIALNLVEMNSALDRRTKWSVQLGDWLLEHGLLKSFNGAMVISNKLFEFYKQIAPNKPILKVPVVCDYDKFLKNAKNPSEPYFLYCASIQFRPVVDFVMNAFRAMEHADKVKLYLLISGKQKKEIDLLRKEINSAFPDGNVELFSNVPYQKLMELFTNAGALLIPLRQTAEDSARFPHKIGEYLATGNPVLTTKVGEINTYFKDGKNAVVAENYDVREFAGKLDEVIKDPGRAEQIGLKGKELGLRTFYFRTYGKSIKRFLEQL